MKKYVLAGAAAVFMFSMGTTALAGHCGAGRFQNACHGWTSELRQNWVRHDCVYADEDCDEICDSCGWHYDRHHAVDDDGYCIMGTCNYDNCGYGQGTGYCKGYCNSVIVPPVSEVQPQGNNAGEVPEEATNSVASEDANGTGTTPWAGGNSGNGTAVNVVPGYGGGGCHGNGHHGRGHH